MPSVAPVTTIFRPFRFILSLHRKVAVVYRAITFAAREPVATGNATSTNPKHRFD
jgi:hypothetical protein